MESRGKYSLLWLIGLVALFTGRVVNADATAISVEADRLEIDSEAQRARFEGRVKARYGQITFTCNKMNVSYDDKGNIISLSAIGNVEVRRQDAVARANRAQLDNVNGRLILTGNPVLIQGKNRLEGEQIQVQLKTGKIDVTKARGTFVFGVGGPK